MKQKIKKTAMIFLMILAAYLGIGYFFHLVVFPEKKPAIQGYFKPGQTFYSTAEKIRQTVVRHENGIVYCSAELGPFAGGPPEHIHETFDESFSVENGELSLMVNGKVQKLKPGQTVHIPKGTPHKPFNETAETIRFKGTVPFPEDFAYNLTQVYGYMDNEPDFAKPPKIIFQMAMFNGAGFDSWIADGPPVFMQKVMTFLVTPMARLLGFRSYYAKYDISRR